MEIRLGPFSLTLNRDVSKLSAVSEVDTVPAVGDPEDEDVLGAAIFTIETLIEENRDDLLAHVDLMDDQVCEFGNALDLLSETAVVGLKGAAGGVEIHVSDQTPKSYRQAAGRVAETVLGAPGLLDPVSLIRHTRCLLKYGNCFVQPVYESGRLAWGTQMPVYEMVRSRGRGHVLGDPAYLQKRNQEEIGRFKHWQIVHLRTHVPNGRRYGRPFTLRTASIHQEMSFVNAMVFTERVGTHAINVHTIDVTDLRGQTKRIQKRRMAYQRRLLKMRSRGSDRVFGGLPPTDLFLPRSYHELPDGSYEEDLNKIERLTSGPSHEDQAGLLSRYYNRFIASLRIPPVMLGIVDNVFPQGYVEIARDVMSWTVCGIQAHVTQLPAQLLFNECVLRGLDPRRIVWEIGWPNPMRSDQRTEAYTKYTLMRADQMALDRDVVDARWVALNRYGLSETEYDELLQRMRQEMSDAE